MEPPRRAGRAAPAAARPAQRKDVIGLCDGDAPQGQALLRFLKGIGAHGFTADSAGPGRL